MNRYGELFLTALFQTTLLLNFWGLFYLFYFAHFVQCFVQSERPGVFTGETPQGEHVISFYNFPLLWQTIPDSIVSQIQPPDNKTTQKNNKVKILWGTLMAVSLLILIGSIVFSHLKLGLNTSDFLFKNSIIFFIIGILEAIFFFFVGWFDFPVSQAKGAADYLQEVLNNIQTK